MNELEQEDVVERERRERGASMLVGIGGLLAILGSMLPWVSVHTAFGSVSRSGIEGGDGILTLIAGVAALVAGAAIFLDFSLPVDVGVTAFVSGALSGGVAFLNHNNIASEPGFDFSNAGAGIWLLYISAGLMVAGGWIFVKAGGTKLPGVSR